MQLFSNEIDWIWALTGFLAPSYQSTNTQIYEIQANKWSSQVEYGDL